MPLEVNEIFIAPNIEKFMQKYNALHDLPTAKTDETKLSVTRENITSRHPTVRTKFNVPTRVTSR